MHAQRIRIEPMRHHKPGWICSPEGEDHYWLWAPNETRAHWAASWQSPTDPHDPDDHGRGDYKRGATMADVLDIFPPEIAAAFAEAVASSRKEQS